MKPFTKKQIRDWRRYEKVRQGGRYKMYDPRARRATGLGSESFRFVMLNYTKLKEASK